MTIFVTSLWNHYMPTVCPRMAELLGEDNFRLVLVRPRGDGQTQMRRDMKWDMEPPNAKWVMSYPTSVKDLESAERLDLIEQSEVAIIGALYGSRKLLSAVDKRIKAGKLTLFTNERFIKQYLTLADSLNPLNLYRWYRQRRIFDRKNVHYLPISHWGPSDLRFFGSSSDRIWNWGYFPYLTNHLTPKKDNGVIWIGWCGRMDELKHVDHIVHAISQLPKEFRERCRLSLIGGGECWEKIQLLVKELDLTKNVDFMPYQPMDVVRKWMEGLDVYVFPSDIREGWGVVIAEAMDKCCVPISCIEAGVSLDLVEDGENGFVFEKGDVQRIAKKLQWLIEHPVERCQMGVNAWRTMQARTPDKAADRLVALIRNLQKGDANPGFSTGLCSRVQI